QPSTGQDRRAAIPPAGGPARADGRSTNHGHSAGCARVALHAFTRGIAATEPATVQRDAGADLRRGVVGTVPAGRVRPSAGVSPRSAARRALAAGARHPGLDGSARTVDTSDPRASLARVRA